MQVAALKAELALGCKSGHLRFWPRYCVVAGWCQVGLLKLTLRPSPRQMRLPSILSRSDFSRLRFTKEFSFLIQKSSLLGKRDEKRVTHLKSEEKKR